MVSMKLPSTCEALILAPAPEKRTVPIHPLTVATAPLKTW